MFWMRCGIRAEHHFGVGFERDVQQGFPVFGAFGDGFAKEVGLQHASRYVIERNEKVVQGDRRIEVVELLQRRYALPGRDMLHDDLEFRKCRSEFFINGHELRFAVHDETVGLPVDTEGDIQVAHRFECRTELLYVETADTPFGIGRDARRVEFDRCQFIPHLFEKRSVVVGLEEECHIGSESLLSYGFHDTLFIGNDLFLAADGRYEVGHDDGAAEGTGALFGDIDEHLTVSEVEVHIERGIKSHCG